VKDLSEILESRIYGGWVKHLRRRDDPMRRTPLRFALAIVLTAMTPALAYFSLQFFVSGATFYKGSRDWGHVYKYLGIFLLLWPLMTLATLVLGGGILVLARRFGPLNFSKLAIWASPVCVILGLVAWGYFRQDRNMAWIAFWVPLALVTGLLLVAEFSFVAGLPWRAGSAASPSQARKLVDRAVTALAIFATLAGVFILVGSSVVAIMNPCCG
jgi:hypothetical protein